MSHPGREKKLEKEHLATKAKMEVSELVLSSLVYNNRELFVFQDILPHLPKEKAELAAQRAKECPKYTNRIGICEEWVFGDSRKILEDRHFLDASFSQCGLLFSGVLVDAKHFEELLHESFDRKFTLKVEQFTLTEESFASNMFEWYFNPQENDGSIKKTKITQRPENDEQGCSIINDEKIEKESETSEEEQSLKKRSYKRRRSSFLNGEENQDLVETNHDSFLASVSEAVLLRPRKKAKEATTVINSLLELETTDNGIVRNLPGTPQRDSPQHNSGGSTPSSEQNETPSEPLGAFLNPSQDEQPFTDDSKNTPTASQDDELGSTDLSSQSATISSLEKSLLEDSSTLIQNIKLSEHELFSGIDDCDPVTSSSVDMIDNQETTSILPDELEGLPCDGNIDPQKDSNEECDSNAQVNSGNSSGSTVCLCTNQEQNNQTTDRGNSKVTEATELLEGLIAAGFVPHVRELLENIKSDTCKKTKVSQMECELKTLRNQIQTKKRMNQQLELSVKKKARELEKLFENLRKGKAQCEMLEEKYKVLECEKSNIDAKLKKCLEVLNSID